ncbi:phosphatidylglycerol lysyltransferase domain-containing protein [Streptomyces sp. NPDC088785]|uniref:phosphatidylglycerol lysyltransferase domain-containing protein n=1 Tax=Streptomyces sp. NPDC088785 TaxID=3365897 RepID=UPI003824FDF9
MFARIDAENSPGGARRTRRAAHGPRPEATPALIARACLLVGVLDTAAGAFPRLWPTHAPAAVLPGALRPFAAALALGSGVLLLLLAHGLRRRKRRAWRAAVVLLPLGACAQFAYRHSFAGVVVPLVLLGVLARHRARFDAPPDPRGRWRALAHFVVLGAGSILVGLLIVSARPHRLVGDPSLADRLRHVLYGLFGLDGPLHYAGGASRTVDALLGTLGLITALTTAYFALRPEHPAVPRTEDDESRLRALLDRHGARDSPGRSALRRDTGVVFSPSGKAAVRYRVASGVMLAHGDPVGDVEAWPGAIERFMDEARAHSWTPAVAGCSATGGGVWTRETGLAALGPGDEAVADVADLSLTGRTGRAGRTGRTRRSGRAMRAVGRMVRRTGRAGQATRVRRVRDPAPAERDRIRRAAAPGRNDPLIGPTLRPAPRLGTPIRTRTRIGIRIGRSPLGFAMFRREPRSMVSPSSGDLPRTGRAALRADGFVRLRLPGVVRRRAPEPHPGAHPHRREETRAPLVRL